MATFDYTKMLAVANKLLDKFGQAGTLTIPGAKTGDAWNPTIGATSSVDCVLVETDYSQGQIDGVSILATDKQVYVKVGGMSAEIVALSTQIVYGGKTFQIVGPVKQINPAGTNLVWIIQARA